MSYYLTIAMNTLAAAGLSTHEALVYRTSLMLGTAPASSIAESAQLLRSTTYQILDRLIEVGLVTVLETYSVKHYVPNTPQKLVQLATQRMNLFQESVPELFSLWSTIHNQDYILVGVSTIFATITAAIEDTSRVVIIGDVSHETINTACNTFLHLLVQRDIHITIYGPAVGVFSDTVRSIIQFHTLPEEHDSKQQLRIVLGSYDVTIDLEALPIARVRREDQLLQLLR